MHTIQPGEIGMKYVLFVALVTFSAEPAVSAESAYDSRINEYTSYLKCMPYITHSSRDGRSKFATARNRLPAEKCLREAWLNQQPVNKRTCRMVLEDGVYKPRGKCSY